MTACEVRASGGIDLYFYDELAPMERQTIERHLADCLECRAALDELNLIRTALATRPDVAAPASGDWSRFMSRLEASLATERRQAAPRVASLARQSSRPYLSYVAIAALLALVTFSVFVAMRPRAVPVPAEGASVAAPAASSTPKDVAAFTSMTEEHFERSKLVVLGLAAKDARQGSAADWAYERELATALLNDTRIYRLAAEDRGLDRLAGVMRDLELVLLQTSLTDDKDPASLPQLQRLIQRRDLIEKMDASSTKGL